LVGVSRLTYFGFELENVEEMIKGEVPQELHLALREGLTDALLAGETVHPDQGRLRRSLEEAGELWRRSGGTLGEISGEALRYRIRAQLDSVNSWETFLGTRILLDPLSLVSPESRDTLYALPSSVRLLGDAVPLDYEVAPEGGVVRLRLREGQARRLREHDLPNLDRPMRFAVVRGNHPALRGDTLQEVRILLSSAGTTRRHGKTRGPKRRRR